MTGAFWLSLTQVFDGTKHVLCNGFLVLDNLLDDDGLGEALLDAFRHDGFCRSVKQLLLTVAEGVCLDWAGSISDTRVGSPVVVASSLLARTEVTVRALIHFLCLVFLLHGASRWVEDILG